jgi:electron transfer flavoprotein alpha subunit
MAISKIWVFAEADNGKVVTSTLELLTAARATGATVEAFVAGDGAAVAAELGAYGASKVYSTGDLGGALASVPAAAAMAALVAGGNAPDAILLAQTYEGRDTAGRLSVKLDKTVLTNAIGFAVDGDSLNVEHAVFGRQDTHGQLYRHRSVPGDGTSEVVCCRKRRWSCCCG